MLDRWNDFEKLGRLLERQDWIYAKTMPENPHHYTLRKKWQNDDDFVWSVNTLRKLGYKAYYGGRPYIQIDVNEHFYWTMGAPVLRTILINRKSLKGLADYDAIASSYEYLFIDSASKEENTRLFDFLGDVSDEFVLDIGCGTGFFLDYALPSNYVGIDVSQTMISIARQKHPTAHFVHTSLASYVGGRYDLIVALFGVGSYLTHDELQRIPTLLNPGGRAIVMFYDKDYTPITYQKTGVSFSHRHYSGIPGGDVSKFGNYTVVQL